MSYNNEPQFNPQSATVQAVCDYITFSKEWLMYFEGYTDTYPDTPDYAERFIKVSNMWYESLSFRSIVEHQLSLDIVGLYLKDSPTLAEQVTYLGLAAYSIDQGKLALGNAYAWGAEIIQSDIDNPILQEIFNEFRDDSSYVFYCDDCEEWFHIDQEHCVNNKRLCDECLNQSYTHSEYSDEWIPNEDVVEAIDSDGYTVRLHCNRIPDEFEWNEDNDRYEHVRFLERTNCIIGDYHENRRNYYPVPSPWTARNKRYFGVELEVEVTSDNDRNKKARAIRDYVEENFESSSDLPIVFERDGSLNHGFEIISQPFGLDKHRELWAWTNQPTITRGLRSHLTDTCGIHVHVNRDSLTNLTIARAVYFINHQANKHLINTVARRYNAGYCKAKSKKLSTSHLAGYADRYEMVNITNNKTIEFRIFRGSLKYEAIISAIEFCHAVLNFAAHNSNLHLSTEAFLKFIFEPAHRTDTAYLRQYLMERNPSFRKDFERLVKPEMKKLIPKPELILQSDTNELVEV